MLSPAENFKPLSDKDLILAYTSEIRALDRMSARLDTESILARFAGYKDLLKLVGSEKSSFLYLPSISGEAREVSIADSSQDVQELFAAAHIAACSVLLEGMEIDLSVLVSGMAEQEMCAYMQEQLRSNPKVAFDVMQRLVGMDAMRAIQLLRLSGLVTRDYREIRQLGLGAATGRKDIYYVHMEPVVNSLPGRQGVRISFSTKAYNAADIIISDLDERHAPLYREYARSGDSISGIIGDTNQVLEEILEKGARKRNLVTMLRIEPAMIPDINDFLAKLSPILEDEVDFILTIGAGNSPEAYKQRIGKICSLYNKFRELGMMTVIFKLHLGGSVMQQASSLQFGNAATASYEILYCKIRHDQLDQVTAAP